MTTVAQKDPDVAAEYTLDWEDVLVTPMERDTDYSENDVVRPVPGNGWYYEATTAGRTGQSAPSRLPKVAGETVNDGSVVWTTRHPDDVSLPAVQSAAWSVPTGITKDSQSESGFLTQIVLSGGEDGEDYDVTCRMTPPSGRDVEKTITVPVRQQ